MKIQQIKDTVKQYKYSLVFPEATDLRVLKAAEIIYEEQLVGKLVLLGNPEQILKAAEEEDIDLDNIEIIDHTTSSNLKKYARTYYDLRKEKGLTEEEAIETLKDPVYYAMAMVREGEIDTAVMGSVATSGKVIRAGYHLVEIREGLETISSCFLMITPNVQYGHNGMFLYADSAVVPDPTSEQLADIAITTADTARLLLETEPIVAMLSFSTKGSAQHKSVDKVLQALEIVKQKRPDLKIDGELQADAAICPEVGERKAQGSIVAGKANVLIFPDLDSGNICYKLTERLAKAEAYGPLLQGLKKTVSDLSRGCDVNDIVNVSAITLLRVREKEIK